MRVQLILPSLSTEVEVTRLKSMPLAREPLELDNQAVTMRLFLPMLVEATRVLEEKLVRDVRDVDLGLIFGIGFPPFRGGLLNWADTLGAAAEEMVAKDALPTKQRKDTLRSRFEGAGERLSPRYRDLVDRYYKVLSEEQ